MVRGLALSALVVASLLVAPTGGAALAADAGSAALTVSPSGTGQFVFQVQNIGTPVIASFVLVFGPGFSAGSVVSVTGGNCQLSGGAATCAGFALAGGCDCNPGQSTYITISGSGDPAGSSVTQIGAYAGQPAAPGSSAPVVAQTPATSSPAKPATVASKAKVPRCKRGQHSTKKRPCRK